MENAVGGQPKIAVGGTCCCGEGTGAVGFGAHDFCNREFRLAEGVGGLGGA
ncbi:hypothetical protein [Streptomyces sp. Ac-502]|uniref:hypothetical protein n=1 Tax=Streptomyces sp. Ac-502 TaxID=3342801 RepID=UPI0038627FB8